MGRLRITVWLLAILVSLTFSPVSLAIEDEYSSEWWDSEEEVPARSLHGDTDVNKMAGLKAAESSEDVEPLFYHSDESVYYSDEEDGENGDVSNDSDMDGTSFEVLDVVKPSENDTVVTKPSETTVKNNPGVETSYSSGVKPIIDVAPALDLKPILLTSSEEVTNDQVPLDAPALVPEEHANEEHPIVPDQTNNELPKVPETPELEIIPHGFNTVVQKVDEKFTDEDISDEFNSLEQELKRYTNPRYAAIARNHRVLLTTIIISFFALAVATVLLSFYRGYLVFSRVIRRRSGVNYRRMQEELDPDTLHPPVFQTLSEKV